MLYGSTKPGVEPYKLVYPNYYDIKYKNKEERTFELVSLFSVRNKTEQLTVKLEYLNEINDFNEKYILSKTSGKVFKDKDGKTKTITNFTNINLSPEEEQAIKEFISNQSQHFPDHDLDAIEHIKKKLCGLDIHYFVRLTATHHKDPNAKVICPFKGEPHSRDSCPIYLHISKEGMVMKCNDAGPACQGKSYPSKHIPIPTQVSNIIFQNNLTIVHNYANEEIKYDKKIY